MPAASAGMTECKGETYAASRSSPSPMVPSWLNPQCGQRTRIGTSRIFCASRRSRLIPLAIGRLL